MISPLVMFCFSGRSYVRLLRAFAMHLLLDPGIEPAKHLRRVFTEVVVSVESPSRALDPEELLALLPRLS